MFNELRSRGIPCSKYVDDDDEGQKRVVDVPIPKGHVVCTTMLGARGTDFKINGDDHGGLHVVVTFMPPTQRALDQAFGRAGRSGARGSAVALVESSLTRTQLKEQRRMDSQAALNAL